VSASAPPGSLPGIQAPPVNINDVTGPPEPASTGNAMLDHLLRGGLPRSSACLLVGPPYCGKELVSAGLAHSAARAGDPIIVVLTNMTPQGFRALVNRFGPGFDAHEQAGMVAYIDCYAGMLGDEPDDPHVVAAPSPDEPESLLRGLVQARAKFDDPSRLCIVLMGLTDLALRTRDQGPGHSWLQRLLGQVRRWGATTTIAVERGVHTEAELSLFRHLCDGSIEFHEAETARTYLRARGLAGVATRDWVEYVCVEDGLDIIGSFTEQKIR
jgi:KaiC/GvpD/RAD55 family RecA-like ATPase